MSWLFPDERQFFEHFGDIATRLTAVATAAEAEKLDATGEANA